MFELNEILARDTIKVGEFRLSTVLLSKDANYPWCILVPRKEGITELFHLDAADQRRLMAESMRLSQVMADCFAAKKMNVASLGNVVAQLHIHHIARYEEDACWPNPVWGAIPSKAYSDEALAERLQRLRTALAGEHFVES